MSKTIPISATPALSENLHQLKSLIAMDVLPGTAARDRAAEFPLVLFAKLHREGWLRMYDSPVIDHACVIREMAYGSAGIATSMIGNLLGISPVIFGARAELREELLRAYDSRFSLWAFCMTEPEAGTDIHNNQTIARRVPGGYSLTGQKWFITNANYAEHLVVFARVEGEVDPRSPLTAFYVPAATAGVKRGAALEKMGHRDSNTGTLQFNDVFCPTEHRLGHEGEGIALAFRALHRTKTLFAAAAIGTCDRAADIAVERLSQRVHYGKPLLAQPAVRNLLAELHTEREAAWLLACQAAAAWDAGESAIREASMAKLFAGHVAVKFTSQCLELCGGYGFTTDLEMERLYRDAKLYEIIEGASVVQQILIAKELFRAQSEAARAAGSAAPASAPRKKAA